MALSILSTQVDAATIEAATWNAEFNNIYNNPISLISPVASDITWNDNVKATFGTGGDADIYYDNANLIINPQVAGSGSVLIGGTADNTKMGLGVTIFQGANDDEILAFKSSDVSHGMTDDAQADTYGTFTKAETTSGGLTITGWKDADGSNFGALILQGHLGEEADTGTANSSHGVIRMIAQDISGSGVAAVAAGGNILSVGNASTTRFIIQGDGDFFVTNRSAGAGDVVAGLISDEWDDVALCRALDHDKAGLGAGGLILDEWDKFVTYRRKELIEAGIFDTDNPDALMNMSQLSRLHNGAIWQLGKKSMQSDQRLQAMEQKLLGLESHG